MKKFDDMNSFEKRLKDAPPRRIPSEWRAEILSQAKTAARIDSGDAADTVPSTWQFLSSVFWPSPKAWTGLAAVWVFIILLDHGSRMAANFAVTTPPPTPELMIAIQNQQREIAELLRDPSPRMSSPPPPALKPRTESNPPFHALHGELWERGLAGPLATTRCPSERERGSYRQFARRAHAGSGSVS